MEKTLINNVVGSMYVRMGAYGMYMLSSGTDDNARYQLG